MQCPEVCSAINYIVLISLLDSSLFGTEGAVVCVNFANVPAPVLSCDLLVT